MTFNRESIQNHMTMMNCNMKRSAHRSLQSRLLQIYQLRPKIASEAMICLRVASEEQAQIKAIFILPFWAIIDLKTGHEKEDPWMLCFLNVCIKCTHRSLMAE